MTLDIGLTLAVLLAAVLLFVFEVFRVDVVALVVVLSLAWLGLVTPAQAFSGMASGAVMSMIAIMILGAGVDRSGILNRLIRPLLNWTGSSERKLTAVVSSSAGLLSAFMQNIGAAALFLPAVMRISRRTRWPLSRLLMPLGYAAILGGTLTMVGSGSLIVLNDLLKQKSLAGFGLFSVTPLGVALLATGIAYFAVLGRRLLPDRGLAQVSPQQELIDTWKLPSSLFFCRIPRGSDLAGKTREEARLWSDYRLYLLALEVGHDIVYAPWRHFRFQAGQLLILMGARGSFEDFVRDHSLTPEGGGGRFERLHQAGQTGFAEMILPPRSPLAGRSLRDIGLRERWAVDPIALLSGSRAVRDDFSDQPLQAGDTLVVYGTWANIAAMGDRKHFFPLTGFQGAPGAGAKPWKALACFAAAVSLPLLGFSLPVSLMSGALAMVLLGVLKMDEAYQAVDWKTVFLLAGLIPLGIAMDQSGAAAFIAEGLFRALEGTPVLVLMAVVALLSTILSLFMSNVAATVLLVPLIVLLAGKTGLDPRPLTLLAAVCASNSFILPTHQVNALLMTPGGYRNRDFLRAGGLMTLLFLLVAVGMVKVFYL
ncbi:MAG: anion permease [Candidatus Aminicenantes bacterium]|nr:anion permease [Candidatus Aminicenantes bacterium]